uniref:ZP domain-containing protein n=1 Tax=Heterorhabditis bacteriophora TaxID=37862 RepID=A0A1I7X9C9_HETBA
MRKMYIPECNQDYSLNIMRNATFKMDIGRCTDTTYMTIIFSISVYIGKVQTYLTFCNVISQAGQIIHLIDENGCIVDSELMGDLVYNNYMPKIYARAKIFKLMNDERCKYNLWLATFGDRLIFVRCLELRDSAKYSGQPPKCAFTKEEILNRYRSRPKENSIEDSLMTGYLGTINNRYERQIKVSSEWITVQYNQYTNVEQLQERYYISSMMNPHLEDEKSLQPVKHFLMAISYRDPDTNEAVKPSSTEKMLSISSNHLSGSPSFHPVKISPTIDSSEADNIETIPIVEPLLNEDEFNRISTAQNTMRTTTSSRMLISSSLPTLVQSSTAQVIQKNEFEVKGKTKGKIATLHFYTDDTPRESTTNEYTSSTFHNQKNMVLMEDSFSKEFMVCIFDKKSCFLRHAMFQMHFSKYDHYNKVMISRYVLKTYIPVYVSDSEFLKRIIKERELQQAAQTRVLEQDHPWIHVDAFVEPRTRNKHEIDMNRL